jgi:hypothetical protein
MGAFSWGGCHRKNQHGGNGQPLPRILQIRRGWFQSGGFLTRTQLIHPSPTIDRMTKYTGMGRNGESGIGLLKDLRIMAIIIHMDLPDDFKPKGALLECFKDFPQFGDDFDVLVAEGYLEVTGSETCKWVKSKTSLAQYFKWAGYDAEWVTGGFWAPIARVFGETQRRLSKNASPNANPLKPAESRDFAKIKAVLQRYRKQQEIKETEQRIYHYIKKLVLFAEDETPETIHEIVHKIGAIFIRNVDKNVQKRR